MEKLQSLFKTATGENLDSPISFSLKSMVPHEYNGEAQAGKIDAVLVNDGTEYLWSGVAEKKFVSTSKAGGIQWQAKVGDEIDITLRPPVPGGKFSWYYVCAKGFYKPEVGAAAAKVVFANTGDPVNSQAADVSGGRSLDFKIGMSGIFQCLLNKLDKLPSDEDVLSLLDRAIEIEEMKLKKL